MRFSNFEALLENAKGTGPVRVSVAAADDKEVLEAIKLGQEEGFVEPILTGNSQKIKEIALEIGLDLTKAELIDESDPIKASNAAVDAVVEGKAQFLMKGLVNTSDFLRAVLRSERGLRTGRLLSHLGAFEVPGFPHLFFVTDGGMNIAPDLNQKKEILQNSLEYMQNIGMELVKVVALTANEMPSPKMPSTMDAKALTDLNKAGEFSGALIEGPLALDCAISPSALKHKGIQSEVNGDADMFLVPSIEVGNVLGKAMVYFAGGAMAGIVLGAKVPIVLTSRNDPPRSKLMALAMAALNKQAENKQQVAK